jgi:imidazole glycerol-phosphate synthase subunit HisF
MATESSKSSVRVIARLDVKGPNVIKGIQFDGNRVLGTPEYFAGTYYRDGIDELIFQDTVASLYRRNSLHDIVKKTAERVFIPMTVAGGIRTIEDIRQCLNAGADKVAINTYAIERPEFLKEAVSTFGSQCIVASLEVYRYSHQNRCEIWTDYGRQETGIEAFEWLDRVMEFGVGEVMLTSINREGTGRGYDIDLISEMSKRASIPIIAAGGAGSSQDLVRAAVEGCADAVAAASIFHYKYCKTEKGRINMSFNEKRLRMGDQIDSGNIEFLNFGYGGFSTIPVHPTTISEAKKRMGEHGIYVRSVHNAS